jgi:hypothetical protein
MQWDCYCCVHLEQFCVSLQSVPDPYLIFCFILAVSVIILMVGKILVLKLVSYLQSI